MEKFQDIFRGLFPNVQLVYTRSHQEVALIPMSQRSTLAYCVRKLAFSK